MSAGASKRKKFLFVDDDAGFLASITELFGAMAQGSWEIFTAENHAQALSLLHKHSVDVVVLDIGMPVMDGPQFLRLLGRTHPGKQIVMLSGRVTEESRKTCLENGALLLLEKPVTSEGFGAIFAALDALASASPQAGFRGMMQRVGLQEVLQMECLGRKSSVLEIFTPQARGRIYISEGSIIHAESGALQGEVALYGLLGLQGGEFNILIFSEPARRTIEGHWENLLMEGARLIDEGTTFFTLPAPEPESPEPDLDQPVAPAEMPTHTVLDLALGGVRIEEVALCSGAGEVLYEWECKPIEPRLELLNQVEQQAAHLNSLAPFGRFDRLEIQTGEGRIICQVQPDRRLFVRSAHSKEEVA
jgi:CheY-like chemotaxis protein